MEGKKLLRSIRLQNVLSYGPDTAELPLEPLNVFIGPNASGKSNFIEALSILRAAPRELQAPIWAGGGTTDWVWKGELRDLFATIEATVSYGQDKPPLRYRLSFADVGGRFHLLDEIVQNASAKPGEDEPFTYYSFSDGNPVLNIESEMGKLLYQQSQREIQKDQSILRQRRDPINYPAITYLATLFESVAFYRRLDFGRSSPSRLPQRADLPDYVLLEDSSNLVLVLNDLENRPSVKQTLLSYLRRFYGGQEVNFTTKVRGGTVQVLVHEEGLLEPLPATRLSDGTLRFLGLLTILCHPEPPPVICIEEPELGLHPDVIPIVAELLVEASSRTQLFVTTHSDSLVDALNDYPEAIVVCERRENGTELRRLQPDQLREWLKTYRLGELWQMGEIGGNP